VAGIAEFLNREHDSNTMARLLPIYLTAVVSIEVEADNNAKRPIATGFLFGKRAGADPKGSPLYRVFLVTNRHVFQNPSTKKYVEKVFLRLNKEGGKETKYYPVDLLNAESKPIWIQHDDERVDIAVLSINGQMLREEGISFFFFTDDEHTFLMRDREAVGIATGDSLFVLGFPMGIRGELQNAAIARKGIIARIDDELLKEHYFYVDTSVYPGNSGGPVIIEAEIMAVGGTKSVNQTRLIGVVSSGVTYQDIAVSQQTGRSRVIFEEQTGLTRVVPIDSVIEAIGSYLKKLVPAPPEKAVEAPNPSTESAGPSQAAS